MEITLRGPLADAGIAWDVLSDTDALNRAAGNAAMVSRVEQTPNGPVVTGELTGPMGLRMPFRETGGWVEQRWFRQYRTFTNGPLNRTAFELELVPEGEGVRPRIRLSLEGPLAFRPLIAASGRRIERAWQRILDGLPAPGGMRTRDVDTLPDPLAAALRAWGADEPDPRIVDALASWLRTGTPLELQQIRAFACADRWGLDRHDVLCALLRAVPAGVLELYWSVRCPRCHGEVGASRSLSDLTDHADCASCDVGFGNDLGSNVEVLFAPHPGLLPRAEQSFCSFFPAGAPEIKGALRVPAGASVDETIVLGPGRFTLGVGEDAVVVLVGSSGPNVLSWSPGDTVELQAAAGRIQLALSNPTDHALRVTLVADDALDRVPASLLMTLPAFKRDLGSQALATDTRLSACSITLLFTDLSGSTAMFEALGDAPAYALVAEHFRLLTRVVEAHRGTVVKTIGDAIMASFHRTVDAMEAAFALRATFDAWIATQDVTPRPRLNVGVHVGPALVAESAAHGLDYFGRTVNLAARAQGAASDGEVAFTEAARNAHGVEALLADRVCEERIVPLKGIGDVRLWVVRREER
jgi:class 3 adenylate cyclase